jgi:hypothetical protein
MAFAASATTSTRGRTTARDLQGKRPQEMRSAGLRVEKQKYRIMKKNAIDENNSRADTKVDEW